MFWRMAGFSTTSPVESLLDKDTFTLEELLDEDELIQECKSLNMRLINFLRTRSQIEHLVRYVVEEPPEGADNKRAFKFPFIACEIFTCEIEVIIKTVVEDEEIMGTLFSFLDCDRPHGTLLAGYFSKVVICLLLRKTAAMMRYLQAHQEILQKLVDLIGITSIMEVLIRLVGVDETINAFHEDSLHWLADTDLLEMLMEKLSRPNPSEAHANAAEALSAVSRLSQSALATKLSSPSYIARLFHHALEDPESKSTLVHSLSVCISLLDPKKYVLVGMGRGQYVPDSSSTANPETIEGMLQRLGDLLQLLDVTKDERVLLTTYGELCPPMGTHRLKIVEFIAVLLRTNSEGARQELVKLGAIQTVLRLFFQYPFNNLLHHHVENVVMSCLESNSKLLIDHLLNECDLVGRLLEADGNPYTLTPESKPTVSVAAKAPPRIGNIGHLTRIANRLVQAANRNQDIQAHLQGKPEWVQWQANVLQSRNATENVCQWTCGRPTSVRDRPVDSDDDDFREGVNAMAQHLTREVFRYDMYNEDADEGLGATERDDDVFFDDESAEVVISSLRLGEEHDSGRSKDSFLSGGNWFAFSDDRSNHSMGNFLVSSTALRHEESQGNDNVSSPNSSSSDDEVVVGEDDELVDTANSVDNPFLSPAYKEGHMCGSPEDEALEGRASTREDGTNLVEDLSLGMEKVGVSDTHSYFQDEKMDTDVFSVRPPDWASWNDVSSSLEGTSGRMAFSSTNNFKEDKMEEGSEAVGSDSRSDGELMDMPSLNALVPEQLRDEKDGTTPIFGESVKFIGVEPDGTAKGMENALREGVVGEAGPMHPVKHIPQSKPETQTSGDLDFNDVNYWRSDYNQSVAEVESI